MLVARRALPVPLLCLAGLLGAAPFAQDMAQFAGPQPSVGELTASPPNFVFNTPTEVVFRVQIDSPTLNPTTVQLQRLDAAGAVHSTVGRMFDNGTNGDQKPGDRVFTSIVRMNEADIGRRHFRVVAAFRGNQQNAQSSVAFIDVDPIPLPPDPGEAGKQTLEGIDTDKDGVRDDVQRHVGLAYPDSASTRTALTDYAVAVQKYMTAREAEPTLSDLTDVLTATNCVVFTMGVDDASIAIPELQSVAMNTTDRFKAYLASWKLVHELPRPPLESELPSLCSR